LGSEFLALPPQTHDWRPGDRIASIAVSEPTAKTGLGTIQRVILDKVIVVWDDGKQSTERIQDLIYGGYDKDKIILKSESWWGEEKTDVEFAHIQSQIKTELSAAKERVNVNRSLIAGFPLDITGTGINWGS
jgi:hypothetical protein